MTINKKSLTRLWAASPLSLSGNDTAETMGTARILFPGGRGRKFTYKFIFSHLRLLLI
jgi:hypothetical protein